MDIEQLFKTIMGIFEGGTAGNILKLVMAALAIIGFFLIKWVIGRAAIDRARRETEEGHAKDQAENKTDAADQQDQLDNGKTKLEQEKAKLPEVAKVPKHENNGKCARCAMIFDAYPGFFAPLRSWFESFQARCPQAHISDAGRGKKKQAEYKASGASKADYSESSHNWNAAIDIFEMGGDPANIYESVWFNTVLKPELDAHPELKWYGRPDATFKEVPHVEQGNWRELAKSGVLKLVE